MSFTYNYSIEFEKIECCRCGVHFAITQDRKTKLEEDKETFYCPNGHPQNFVGNPKITELTDEVKRLEKLVNDNWELHHRIVREKNDEIYFLERDQCPTCEKWYKNLEAHIQNKHS